MDARLISRIPVLVVALGSVACAPVAENVKAEKPALHRSAFDFARFASPEAAVPWAVRSPAVSLRDLDRRRENRNCANIDNMPVIRGDTTRVVPMPAGNRKLAESALPIRNGCIIDS